MILTSETLQSLKEALTRLTAPAEDEGGLSRLADDSDDGPGLCRSCPLVLELSPSRVLLLEPRSVSWDLDENPPASKKSPTARSRFHWCARRWAMDLSVSCVSVSDYPAVHRLIRFRRVS